MKAVDLSPLIKHLSSFQSLKHARKAVLVRNCESQGNLAGTITGWMDVPLSDFGRKQAFHLSQALGEFDFDAIHCSDLHRSVDTSFYAMAFPNIVGLYFLMPVVKKELDDYVSRIESGDIERQN